MCNVKTSVKRCQEQTVDVKLHVYGDYALYYPLAIHIMFVVDAK